MPQVEACQSPLLWLCWIHSTFHHARITHPFGTQSLPSAFYPVRCLQECLGTDSMILITAYLWNLVLNVQWSAVLVMNLDSTNTTKPKNCQDTQPSNTEMARIALGAAYSRRWQFFKQPGAEPCWAAVPWPCWDPAKISLYREPSPVSSPGAHTALHLFHQRMEQAWNISWIMNLSCMSHTVLWNCADGSQIPHWKNGRFCMAWLPGE